MKQMKQMKECKIVMLPTSMVEGKVLCKYKSGELSFDYEPLLVDDPVAQHLYFISNDDIKEGDYMIDKRGVYHNKVQLDAYIGLAKVICSSDTTLGLPLIPESFIKAYVEAQGKIDSVQIEIIPETDLNYACIKTRDDNTCIVHTAKFYSRDELCSCMQYYYEYIVNKEYVTPMEWLDKHKHF